MQVANVEVVKTPMKELVKGGGSELRGKRNLSYDFLNVSNPPTKIELDNFEDVSPAKLPPTYKRNILDRIFVNRDLRLDRIRWFGFDMDYTLAVYKSPEYESMTYDLLIKTLLNMGYPEELRSWKYDANFPVRGLLLDKNLGHFLKIDAFGHIVLCVHGRISLSKKETSELYPSLYVSSDQIGKRFYPLSTLFNLPEICLFADLITYFENKNAPLKVSQENSKISKNDTVLSYTNLFADIRNAMDVVHLQGQLKQETLANLSKFIKKTKIATLLDRLRKTGIKSFLLTNSEYYYTDKVMSFLLEGQMEEYGCWRDYFDIVIVSARKPIFFGEGSTLREVDVATGHLKIGKIESLEKGKVYEGGSIKLFEMYTGAKGNQVLYIGDHIYADIIKSKKAHAWRSLLVVPELEHELKVWSQNKKVYTHLKNLEFMKAEAYRGLDSNSTSPPDVSELRQRIKQTVQILDTAYNPYFGSLFRSGTKQSQFSMQVARYADLYTYDYLNLLNYPLFYQFSAGLNTLPHEYMDHLAM